MNKIILGVGFGDEGKGKTTNYLCSHTENPLVVRFNGGHQAGHTVVENGVRHIFSNFGSGTLKGVPTYWSKYCTFYPLSVLNERKALEKFKPKLFVNPLCPVTTPFDVSFNKKTEKINNHGSVGVGFGATIQRQEDYYKLFVQDLFYESVLIAKLRNIADYYKIQKEEAQAQTVDFLLQVDQIKRFIKVAGDEILSDYNCIFEGAQGILLDQDFGFFPNVTRSNTTSKNALEICGTAEIYYVTRTYQTRHGNGYMSNEGNEPFLINNENETNQTHEFQGTFRKSILDIDLLNYSLECDNHFSKNCIKNLVITCADQTGDTIKATKNEEQFLLSIYELPEHLNQKFKRVIIGDGEESMDEVTTEKLFQ